MKRMIPLFSLIVRWRKAVLLVLLSFTHSGFSQDSSIRFGGQLPPEVDTIYERGLAWLASKQTDKGDWQDGYQGAGVNGICLMAFLACGEDPNYGRYAPNIRRAICAIIEAQEPKTGYLPDSMYNHGFAMLALSEAYGVVDESLLWQGAAGEQKRSIAQALELGIKLAVSSQKNNQFGGWRYSPTATDADTSVTGAVLMGLLAARNAGMNVPDDTVKKALDYMARSTGTDGSVAYSGGMGGMGESMNRSAIATLVFSVGRHKDWDQYKATLKHIAGQLEHREAGSYAEYFRYYMAQALFQGDVDAWKKWNAAKIRELQQIQRPDGSFQSGAYGTGMSLLALALNYKFLPIYER